MKTPLLISILGFMALSQGAATAYAETPAQAVDIILQNNPGIVAMRGGINAADAQAQADAQLPGLEIEGEYMASGAAPNKWAVGVSQEFKWPGAYRAIRQAAQAETEALMAQLAQAESELALTASQLINQGVYLTSQLQHLELMKVNLDSISSLIYFGYEKGENTLIDVKKMRQEQFLLSNRLNAVRNSLAEINGELTALSGLETLDVDFSSYPMLTLQPLEDYMQACNNAPQVKALQLQSNAAKIRANTSSKAMLPGFSVGYRHALEENAHFNGVTMSISLPHWGKNYGTVAQNITAQTLNSEASAKIKALQAQTAQTYAQAVSSSKLLSGYREVVLDPEYLDLLQLAYKGGQINLITYLQEFNYYLDARLDYIESLYAHAQSLTQLNNLMFSTK